MKHGGWWRVCVLVGSSSSRGGCCIKHGNLTPVYPDVAACGVTIARHTEYLWGEVRGERWSMMR